MDAEELTEKRLKALRTKKLRDAVSELNNWLPNETREYGEFLFRVLASLPGGERLEDLGYEPYAFLGWKEADMLGKLLEAIEEKSDVEQAVDVFLVEVDLESEEQDG